jgi:UDPglucose 6-dehydrogenase
LGYDVLGLDVDAKKIATLAAGEVPIHEPGLDEILRRNLAAGRLRFTTDYTEAADFGDVHFICVGTPQRADGMGADLSYVETAVTSLVPHLTRKSLIVGKSTVPVGTAAWVEQLVGKHAPADLGIEVAWSPEFLQEGYAVDDVLRPNRLVLGVKTPWAHSMLLAAHKGVFDLALTEDRDVPVVVTDFATAELVKAAANAFLATKISFINAMAEVCEASGADVSMLARAIGYDDRIGKKFLRAGVGFGGACLPKDIRAFQARAQELGAGEALRFLHEVDLINQRRRTRVVQLAAELLDRPYGPAGPDLTGCRIAVLGATFKPGTDDVRDSPALAITRKLARAGAQVAVYDPKGMENARQELPDLEYAVSMSDAAAGADLVCVLTAWEEFRYADPQAVGATVHGRRVIDGLNCLDQALWTAAGWEYRGMGRPTTTA